VNRAGTIIGGAAAVLIATALLIVVEPYVQLHRIAPEDGLKPYTEEQARGRALYVDLGCSYCHSQQPRDPALAPDGVRGWGRPSTPGDYAYDYPHQLGTMRTGPDLFNIGARQPSRDWHLAHLYDPRAVVPGSIMPNYPFLFERRPVAQPGDVVVQVASSGSDAIVAKRAALDLVAYLRALDHTYPSSYLREKVATAGGGR